MSYEGQSSACPLILCDDNGQFVRKYLSQKQGGGVEDVTLAGVAYTTVGTVELCDTQFESLDLLCYCSPTTGEVVAYRAVLRTEEATPETSTILLGSNFLPLANLPQGAVLCKTPAVTCKVCYAAPGLQEAVSGDWVDDPEQEDAVDATMVAGATTINARLENLVGTSDVIVGAGPCNSPNGAHVVYNTPGSIGVTLDAAVLNGCVEIWNLPLAANVSFSATPTSQTLNGPGAWSQFCFEGAPFTGMSFIIDQDGCYGVRVRGEIQTQAGEGLVAEAFGYMLSPGTIVFMDCVTGDVIDPENIIDCPPPLNTVTEVGCITSPASVDLSRADRCTITRIKLGDTTYEVDLESGWTINDFVAAVNVAVGDAILEVEDGTVVLQPGSSLNTLEIFCNDPLFIETFGSGGQDGARFTTPNTNYVFDNTGPIGDGSYGVTSFQDTGLAIFNNNNGNIVADSQGDADGNAFIVNADFDPGEFYRQNIQGLTVNEDVSVSFFAICTNTGSGVILPNIRVDIEDPNNGGAVLETFETGDIPITNDGVWIMFSFEFSTPISEVEFVLVNNAPGGSGNDLAIDQIQFNTVTRQAFVLEPRGVFFPVEIVKLVNPDGSIEILRVWSADGQTEYVLPLENLVLATGQCRPPNVPDEDCCYSGERCYRTTELLPPETSEVQAAGNGGGVYSHNFGQNQQIDSTFNFLVGTGGAFEMNNTPCANPAPGGITSYFNRLTPGTETWAFQFGQPLANVTIEVWDLGPGETIGWGVAPTTSTLNGANAWSEFFWEGEVVADLNGLFDIDCVAFRITAQFVGIGPKRSAKVYLDNNSFVFRSETGAILNENDFIECGDDTDTVSVIDQVVNADSAIPQSRSYSILIETGTATINGAARPEGYSVNQSPQSFGDQTLLYPPVLITNVTGTVHISYVE